MIRLIIFFLILFCVGCKGQETASKKLHAARTLLAEGKESAALTLLLEAESSAPNRRINGEIACEIGRLYRNQRRPDLAWDYYIEAFTSGYLDIDGFAAETSLPDVDPPGIPLSETEYDFRRRQSDRERAQLKKTLRLTLGAGGALLLLGLWGYVWIVRRRRRDTESLLALVDNLNHSTATLLSELDDRKTSESRLKELLANRFSEVRELTDTIYQYEHNPVLLHRKLREVLSLRTTEAALFDDLEEVVDAYRNGLIRRLRVRYPILTQNELQFCALLCAGFSVQEMCILLNIQSVQNVWMKKYRLRCKLGLPAGTDLDAFLHDFAQVESTESTSATTDIENQRHENDTQS